MGGKYEQVGQASDMQRVGDVAGYQSMQGRLDNMGRSLQGSLDPNAYMNQFMGQAGGLANLVSGQNSQLQQGLNAIAQRQAALGGEAALAAMPGMRNSGAGMAAFGQAYADPFAQAQAQLQQNQLQGTLGMWNQAMGQNAQMQGNLQNLYGQNMGLQAGLAQDAVAWYQPQYEYRKGTWDKVLEGATALGGLGSGVGGMMTGIGALR